MLNHGAQNIFALQQDANMCEEGNMQESIKTYQIYPFLSALQKRKQTKKNQTNILL